MESHKGDSAAASRPDANGKNVEMQGIETFVPDIVKRIIRNEIMLQEESRYSNNGNINSNSRIANERKDKNNDQVVDSNENEKEKASTSSSGLHQTTSFLHSKKLALRGVVMVVDISGFTKLASKMTIEMLKKTVNDCFSIIISNINDFSGDIIRFCGDSLIVLWTPKNLNFNSGDVSYSDNLYSYDSFNMHQLSMQASACAMQLVDSIKTSNCKIFNNNSSNSNSNVNTEASFKYTSTTLYNTIGSVVSFDTTEQPTKLDAALKSFDHTLSRNTADISNPSDEPLDHSTNGKHVDSTPKKAEANADNKPNNSSSSAGPKAKASQGGLTVHIGIVSGTFNFLILSSERTRRQGNHDKINKNNINNNNNDDNSGDNTSDNRPKESRAREWLLTGKPLTILSDLLNITTAFEVGICHETMVNLRNKLELIPQSIPEKNTEGVNNNKVPGNNNSNYSSSDNKRSSDKNDDDGGPEVELDANMTGEELPAEQEGSSEALPAATTYYKLTGKLGRSSIGEGQSSLSQDLPLNQGILGLQSHQSSMVTSSLGGGDSTTAMTARTDASSSGIIPLVSSSNICIDTVASSSAGTSPSEKAKEKLASSPNVEISKYRRLSLVITQKITSLIQNSSIDERSNEMSANQFSVSTSVNSCSVVDAPTKTSSCEHVDNNSPYPHNALSPTHSTYTPFEIIAPMPPVCILSSNDPVDLEVLADTLFKLVADIDQVAAAYSQAPCFKVQDCQLSDPVQISLYDETICSFIHSSVSLTSSSESSANNSFSDANSARNAYNASLLFLAEMRSVSTVFLLIRGVDSFVHDGDIHMVQTLYDIFYSCFSMYRGTLRQLVVDDKGLVAVVCFGLNTKDIDIRCLQALHSCIEISRRLEAFLRSDQGAAYKSRMHLQFGISDGVCYIGNIGAYTRHEFINMGNEVNIAARFMSKQVNNQSDVDEQLLRFTKPISKDGINFFTESGDSKYLNLKYTILLDEFVHQCCHCLHRENFHCLGVMTFKGIMRVVVGHQFDLRESNFDLEKNSLRVDRKFPAPISSFLNEVKDMGGDIDMADGLMCVSDLVDDVGISELLSVQIGKYDQVKDNKFLNYLNSKCLVERTCFHTAMAVFDSIFNQTAEKCQHLNGEVTELHNSSIVSVPKEDLDIYKMYTIIKSIASSDPLLSKFSPLSSKGESIVTNLSPKANFSNILQTILVSKTAVTSLNLQSQHPNGSKSSSTEGTIQLDKVHIVYVNAAECSDSNSNSNSNIGDSRFDDCKCSLIALRRLFSNFFSQRIENSCESSTSNSKSSTKNLVSEQARSLLPSPIPAIGFRKSKIGLSLSFSSLGSPSATIHPDGIEESPGLKLMKRNITLTSLPYSKSASPLKSVNMAGNEKVEAVGGCEVTSSPFYIFITDNLPNVPMLEIAKRIADIISGLTSRNLSTNSTSILPSARDKDKDKDKARCFGQGKNGSSIFPIDGSKEELKKQAGLLSSPALFSYLAQSVDQLIEDLDAAAMMFQVTSSGLDASSLSGKSLHYYVQMYVDDLTVQNQHSTNQKVHQTLGTRSDNRTRAPTAFLLIIVALFAKILNGGLDVNLNLLMPPDDKATNKENKEFSAYGNASSNTDSRINTGGSSSNLNSTSLLPNHERDDSNNINSNNINYNDNYSGRGGNGSSNAACLINCNVLVFIEDILDTLRSKSEADDHKELNSGSKNPSTIDQSYMLLEIADILKNDAIFEVCDKKRDGSLGAGVHVPNRSAIPKSSAPLSPLEELCPISSISHTSPSSLSSSISSVSSPSSSSSSSSSSQRARGVVVMQVPGSVLSNDWNEINQMEQMGKNLASCARDDDTLGMVLSADIALAKSNDSYNGKDIELEIAEVIPSGRGIVCKEVSLLFLSKVEDIISSYIDMDYFEKFASIISYSEYILLFSQNDSSNYVPSAQSIFRALSINLLKQLTMYNRSIKVHDKNHFSLSRHPALHSFRNDTFIRIAALILLENFKKIKFGNMASDDMRHENVIKNNLVPGLLKDAEVASIGGILGPQEADRPSLRIISSLGGRLTMPPSYGSVSTINSMKSSIDSFSPIGKQIKLVQGAKDEINKKDIDRSNPHISISTQLVYRLVSASMYHRHTARHENSNHKNKSLNDNGADNDSLVGDSMLSMNTNIQRKSTNSFHKSGTSSLFRNVDLLDEAILKAAALIDSKCEITSRIWKENYIQGMGSDNDSSFDMFVNHGESKSDSEGHTGEFTIGELDLLVALYGIGSNPRAPSEGTGSNSSTPNESQKKEYALKDFVHFHALQAMTGMDATSYDKMLVSRLSKLVDRGILVEYCSNRGPTSSSRNGSTSTEKSRFRSGIYKFSDILIQKLFFNMNLESQKAQTHQYLSKYYAYIYGYMVMKLNPEHGLSGQDESSQVGGDNRDYKDAIADKCNIEVRNEGKLSHIPLYYSRDFIITQMQYHNAYCLDTRKRIHSRNDLVERAVGKNMFTTALFLLSDMLQDVFSFREFTIVYKLINSFHAERMLSNLPSFHKGCSKSLTSFVDKLKRASLISGKIYKNRSSSQDWKRSGNHGNPNPNANANQSNANDREYDESSVQEDSIFTIACLACTCRCIMSSKAKLNFICRSGVATSTSSSSSSSAGGSSSNSNSSSGSNHNFNSNNSIRTNSQSYRNSYKKSSVHTSSRYQDGGRKGVEEDEEHNKLTEGESFSLATLILIKMSSLFNTLKCHKMATIFDTVVMRLFGVTTSEEIGLPDLKLPRSFEIAREQDIATTEAFRSDQGGRRGFTSPESREQGYMSAEVSSSSSSINDISSTLPTSKYQHALKSSVGIPKNTSFFIYSLKKSVSNHLLGPLYSVMSNCLDSFSSCTNRRKMSVELHTFSLNILANYVSSSKFNSKLRQIDPGRPKGFADHSLSLLKQLLPSCLSPRKSKVYMFTNLDDKDSEKSVRLTHRDRSMRGNTAEADYDNEADLYELDLCSYASIFHANLLQNCISLKKKKSVRKGDQNKEMDNFLMAITTPAKTTTISAQNSRSTQDSLHLMIKPDCVIAKGLEIHRYKLPGAEFRYLSNANVSNYAGKYDDDATDMRALDAHLNEYFQLVERRVLKCIFQGYAYIHKDLRSRQVKNNCVFMYGNLDFISELIFTHLVEFDGIFFDLLKPLLKNEFGLVEGRFKSTNTGHFEIDGRQKGDNYFTEIYFSYYCKKWDSDTLGRIYSRCPLVLLRLLALSAVVVRLRQTPSVVREKREKREQGAVDLPVRTTDKFSCSYSNHIIESLIHHIFYSDLYSTVDPATISVIQMCHALCLFTEGMYYPTIKYIFSSTKKLDFINDNDLVSKSLKKFLSMLLCIFGGISGDLHAKNNSYGYSEMKKKTNNSFDGTIERYLISFIQSSFDDTRRENENGSDGVDDVSLLDIISDINCCINTRGGQQGGGMRSMSVEGFNQDSSKRAADYLGFDSIFYLVNKKYHWAFISARDIIMECKDIHDWSFFDTFNSKNQSSAPKNKLSPRANFHRNNWTKSVFSIFRALMAALTMVRIADFYFEKRSGSGGGGQTGGERDDIRDQSESNLPPAEESTSTDSSISEDWMQEIDADSMSLILQEVYTFLQAVSPIIDDKYLFLKPIKSLLMIMWDVLSWKVIVHCDDSSGATTPIDDSRARGTSSSSRKPSFSSEILLKLLRKTSIPAASLIENSNKNLKYLSILWEGHMKLINETFKRDKNTIVTAIMEGLEIESYTRESPVASISNPLNILQYFVEIYLWEIKKMNFYLQSDDENQ